MRRERRAHPRYRVTDFEIVIRPLEGRIGFEDLALLHDISDGGVSFISQGRHRYEPGQRLDTMLPLVRGMEAAASGPLRAHGTVVWVRRLSTPEERFQVGMSLDEWIDAEVVEALRER